LTTPDPKDLRSVRCSVSFSEPVDRDMAATIQLVVHNDSSIHRGSGYRGGTIEVVADTRSASDGRSVHFDGLSRIPYTVVFTAPGYVKRVMAIDPDQDGEIDLGNITLLRAATYEITFRSRVRRNGGEWIADSHPRKATIACDGLSMLRFTDMRTGLGGRLHIHLLPRENEVAAWFPYSWATFHALDAGSVHDLEDFDSIVVDESVEADNGITLENDGLYFFRAIDLNGTDVELLFQPKRI
jgi:hypothetical protein